MCLHPHSRAAWALAALGALAAAQPKVPPTGPVTRLEISETVDPGLAAFVQRVLGHQGRGDVVLLELNTLGGRLDSALAIRDALLHTEATTVCWVNPRAISAGALIALACDLIAVTPDAAMGAATPVTLTLGGDMAPVEAKVVSYFRTEMGNTAVAKGRPREVAEAMVDRDVEIPGLVEKGKLLTLNADQALRWRVADVEAKTPLALWQALGRDKLPFIANAEPSGAEQLGRFLSETWVSGLLIALGLLGVAVEIFHPQGGAALLGGLIALGLFFFGHLVVKLAGAEELALFVAGLVLVAIEWWMPGHTIFGVTGLLMIVVSLTLGLVNLENVPFQVAWGEGWVQHALATVFGGLFASAAALAGLVRVLPASPFGRKLILQATVPPPESQADENQAAVGMAGTAITDLRPYGRVQIAGRKLEARVEHGFVNSGSRVRVLRAEAGAVVVREEPAGTFAGEGAAG